MMNTVDKVKQCSSVQEALLVLAEAIDELAAQPVSDFDAPLVWGDMPGDLIEVSTPDNRARIEGNDVVVEPVSEERQEARRQFADDCRLYEFYGTGLSEDDFLDAYVKGGPRWLYYDARDAVMTMPVNLRQALVADVLLDSPSEADEIGRDILKFSFDEGARETAQLEYHREAREHGPAYRGHD